MLVYILLLSLLCLNEMESYDLVKLNSSNIPEISDFNVNVGQDTQQNRWKQEEAKESPYSVMLFVKTTVGLVSCTGTLVTLQWVLTAASCLKKTSAIEVIIYAGGNNHDEWLNQDLAKGSQVRKSTEYHCHPYYQMVSLFKFYYNVAVVKPEQVFRLSKTVAPIEISTNHLSFANPTHCKVTSFGRVDLLANSKNYFRKTQYISVETPCTCFDEENAYYWICPLLNQPLSICKGDIGAGLVCDGKIKAVIAQIIPARDARSCDTRNPPYYDCLRVNNTINVFQGTCPYLRFINQHVKLFPKKFIRGNCDVEPKKISKKPPSKARASNGPSFTFFLVCCALLLCYVRQTCSSLRDF